MLNYNMFNNVWRDVKRNGMNKIVMLVYIDSYLNILFLIDIM